MRTRKEFEETWGAIEHAAIETLSALDRGEPVFPDVDAQQVIVDLVALHVVRGVGTTTYWEASHRRMEPKRLAAVADGPLLREAAALAGVAPLDFAAALTDGWDDPLRHGGRAFGSILVELVASVASELRSWSLTIANTTSTLLVAPDVACVPVDDGASKVGVLGGIGLNRASRVLMPVGPEHLVVLRPQGHELHTATLVGEEVSVVNELLARAAVHRVWMKPGHSVEAEVAAVWRNQSDPPRVLDQP